MMAIPVVAMIMLSVAGFAYAHWTDLIRINGIVNTGTLNVVFDHAFSIDKEWYNDLPKDVADCNVWLTENVTDVHTNKTGYKKLWINITNAYPSYWCNTTFVLHNIGTVPAVFKNFTLKADSPLDFKLIKSNREVVWEGIDTSLNVTVFNMVFIDLKDVQLDPQDTTKAQLDIHFKQTAPECHTYTFHMEIWWNSWDP